MSGLSPKGEYRWAQPEGIPVDALEALLREQRGRLVARPARSLGLAHLAMAEDAVQTACLRALQRWPVDGTPANLGGWLYRVARHTAIDTLRHDAPQQPLDDDDGDCSSSCCCCC